GDGNGDVGGRVLLVHRGRVQGRDRRLRCQKRLYRRPCRQSDLQGGLRREHRACRGGPRAVRPGRHLLRRHPRHLLRDARPQPAQPAGQRCRHAVSLGHFPARRGAGSRRARSHQALAGRLDQPDRHHDRAALRLVSGRGLSPELLGGRRPAQSLLPVRHPAQAQEAAQKLRQPAEGSGHRRL
ncbi:MAG: Peptide-methionine (S)-S-oxide reductase MsrA, partial [uncultured Sphingosinicella sp.]